MEGATSSQKSSRRRPSNFHSVEWSGEVSAEESVSTEACGETRCVREWTGRETIGDQNAWLHPDTVVAQTSPWA